MQAIYKNWLIENQQVVGRLLEEELDYWLAQVDAVGEKPETKGVARTRTVNLLITKQLPGIEMQNRVMAAVLFALYKMNGVAEHIVFREGHGRNPLNGFDVSGAIGWFTCKYPTKYKVEHDLTRTLHVVAEQNHAVPNGGVGYDVLRHFGPSYINRQLECAAGMLFNYLGDLSFAGTEQGYEEANKLILSAHTGFSSTIEESAVADDSLFALNVNAWTENGMLYCTLDIAPSLGLDEAAYEKFIALVQSYLKELTGAEKESKVKVIPFQKGLISYVFSHPENDNYINQNVFETGIETSFEFFREVCKALTTKYEILRTCYAFDYVTGDFTGTVLPAGTLNCDHYILENNELNNLLGSIKRKKFNIDHEPLIRFSLISTSGGKSIIVITSHHIIIDGTSVMYLLSELMNISADMQHGRQPDLSIPDELQFSAYAEWVSSQDESAAMDYWKGLLAGVTPGLLENHTVGETDQSIFNDVTYSFTVSETASAVLMAQHVTTAAALNYVAGFVLAKYAGRDSFVWGNTVTLRPFELNGAETIVGPCIATVPVAMNFIDGSIINGIKHLQVQLMESQEHAYLTLNDIGRTAGQSQLFSVSYVYQNFVKTQFNDEQSVSYKAHFSHDSNISSHFPMNILVFEEGNGLTIRVKYRSDYFTRSLVNDICSTMSALFNSLDAVKDQPVQDIDLFTVCGTRSSEIYGDRTDLTQVTLHDSFMKAAQLNPGKIAVMDSNGKASYAELDGMSNAICKLLLENNISGAVGVRMKRSVNLIAVIVGILKSGSHVVSLEYDFPAEKIAWIDKNIGLAAAFTDVEGSVNAGCCKVFVVDKITPLTGDIQLPGVSPNALCCINYTSGSTGVPKLVKISHTGHVNRVLWLKTNFPATAEDIYGFKTLLCFGPSLREVFEPLMQGSTLYVYSGESNNHPQLFFEETTRNNVSRLFITPTFIKLLFDCELQESLRTLKYLEISGEPIPVELFERLRSTFPEMKVVGRYGATEAPGTVYYTKDTYNSKRNLPLGKPIFNTAISVVNDRGQVLPAGVIGEIGISGESISTGYINKELEAANFIPVKGKMHVKTGDLGYINPDGILVFQSRKTRMVKIKGYRVEPAEIEFNLLQHAAIKKAIVVPVISKNTTRLTAFFIKQDADAVVGSGELRTFLEQRLPRYMVPHEFTEISKLPLTESGKVDYVTLSKYAVANNKGSMQAPQTDAEKQVFSIISELVDHADFDVLSNFLEIGMDSILTLKAIYKVRKAFGIDADVADMYMHPTVQEFGAYVEKKMNKEGDDGYYLINHKEGNAYLFFVPPIGNNQMDLKVLETAVPANVTLVIFRAITAEKAASVALEEVAAEYVQQLTGISKGLPVNLSGWSLGATIAYEMAVQLQREGVTVNNVLLFDPGFYTPDYDNSLTREKLNDILSNMMRGNANAEIKEKILTDILNGSRLIADYRPSAYYGELKLFKPAEISSGERNYNKSLNGLDAWSKGEIAVTILPGNHMTMLNNLLQNRQVIEESLK